MGEKRKCIVYKIIFIGVKNKNEQKMNELLKNNKQKGYIMRQNYPKYTKMTEKSLLSWII